MIEAISNRVRSACGVSWRMARTSLPVRPGLLPEIDQKTLPIEFDVAGVDPRRQHGEDGNCTQSLPRLSAIAQRFQGSGLERRSPDRAGRGSRHARHDRRYSSPHSIPAEWGKASFLMLGNDGVSAVTHASVGTRTYLMLQDDERYTVCLTGRVRSSVLRCSPRLVALTCCSTWEAYGLLGRRGAQSAEKRTVMDAKPSRGAGEEIEDASRRS